MNKIDNYYLGMTPEVADKWLRELGLFYVNGPEDVYKRGIKIIGEEEMSSLAEHFNGEHENSEAYLSEKCGEDPYFSLIQSPKYTIFKEELLWLDQVLPNNVLVVDLGCSTGHMTALCARMRPCSRFVGVDLIPSVIKKANLIKERLGLANLSFGQHDFKTIKTTPKPDGIISLQAVGAFLGKQEIISHLCSYLDSRAFIILVEDFKDQDHLKNVLSLFHSYGFSLFRLDKIKCGNHRRVKAMPGVFLVRGFENVPEINMESIFL